MINNKKLFIVRFHTATLIGKKTGKLLLCYIAVALSALVK